MQFNKFTPLWTLMLLFTQLKFYSPPGIYIDQYEKLCSNLRKGLMFLLGGTNLTVSLIDGYYNLR